MQKIITGLLLARNLMQFHNLNFITETRVLNLRRCGEVPKIKIRMEASKKEDFNNFIA